MGFWDKFKKVKDVVDVGAGVAKAVGVPVPPAVQDGLDRANRVADAIQPDGTPVITADEMARAIADLERRVTALERQR